MCGILGYSHITKDPQPEVFRSALCSLFHRGPDHQSVFESPQMSLGSTRLRIIDLQNGDQPLFSPDRDVTVVFNGEIFNYCELRDALIAEGFSFGTNCDTEVVLNAFRCWGTECFPRFRGMFAIAIWVASERRLILARDRMGIKPLYYCMQDGEIYFGSELKCILPHPAVGREICLSGLNCFLSLNYVPGPLTLVEGILKLMPGHLLEWRSDCYSVRSYVSHPSIVRTPRSIEEACEELDYLLDESVREELVADVPIGIWLSGGLDSSTILHYAAKCSSQLRTFSITFRGRSFDEAEYIREVSSYFGTQHSDFDLNTSADLVTAIEQIAYYSDEPGADAGALPLWFLARLTSKNVTVVLTGEGSDELLAGYLTYEADRYRAMASAVPISMRKAALALAMRLPVSDEKIGFEYKLKRFLQGSLLSPEMAHVFWNGTFSDEEKADFFLFQDPTPLSSILASMNHGAGFQRYLDFDQKYYLPDDILYKVDRMSMAHALEVRPPFLDPRIVDFAASLPEDFKLRGRQSKYVLRRLMREKLPPTVLRRPKIGFDIPIHDWFRGALRPFLLDTLRADAVNATGLFRWPAVERLVHEHLTRKRNWGYHLWGLMTLLIWMRQWKIKLVAEETVTHWLQVSPPAPVGSLY
ncbi:MAG TPA: asparagine synthase (glutamine-hydrolyzing) [Terriglobales bacterium]|nr:asparagine synthase (glutamine-hydrolyzing) [Terriglobales bacterium]